MITPLRFKLHRLVPLKPLDRDGKYIGKNPFTKKKDDFIVDSYHNYITIKSDNFSGSSSDFKKTYKTELHKLRKNIYKKTCNNESSLESNIKLQRKLFILDTKIQEISSEIKKIRKKLSTVINGSKKNKFFFDTELDIEFAFYVSKKHSAFNPDDDNVVYEHGIYKDEELDRREKEFFKNSNFQSKYHKTKWSEITYYLHSNCSEEDIMCIDQIVVDIKGIVQMDIKTVKL